MRFKLILAAVVVVALGAGFWAASALSGGEPPETGAIVLDIPRDPGAFTLVDHHGDPFGPAEIHGQWTLWFFGFTHCPDICPMTLSTLNLADKALAEADATRPTVVMVSVDPQRDTPEKLAAYVPFFNETFIGVTGSTAAVLTLTDRLGIIVQYLAREGDDYTVEHGASLLLTGPDGLVRAVFTAPHEPQKLAQDLAVLIPWLEKQR
jgi:protein SCO1